MAGHRRGDHETVANARFSFRVNRLSQRTTYDRAGFDVEHLGSH
jgi:hypothetical protein